MSQFLSLGQEGDSIAEAKRLLAALKFVLDIPNVSCVQNLLPKETVVYRTSRMSRETAKTIAPGLVILTVNATLADIV